MADRFLATVLVQGRQVVIVGFRVMTPYCVIDGGGDSIVHKCNVNDVSVNKDSKTRSKRGGCGPKMPSLTLMIWNGR